jgi:hypothetical protein
LACVPGLAVNVYGKRDSETPAFLHVIECVQIILTADVVTKSNANYGTGDFADQFIPVDLALVL